MDPEWLNSNFGDYSEPWQGNFDDKDLESGHKSLDFNQRRRRWMKQFQYKVLHSPMVPLIIRLTVFIFCVIALALGGSIRYNASKYDHPQGPSADMAIIVDAVALVYLVWITWDEYTGKPLGLRPAKAKMRLIFLDLIFIVFNSANLSLAFESLNDVSGSCTSAEINKLFDPKNDMICERQKVLAAVLLIVLIAWLTTFTISILRYINISGSKGVSMSYANSYVSSGLSNESAAQNNTHFKTITYITIILNLHLTYHYKHQHPTFIIFIHIRIMIVWHTLVLHSLLLSHYLSFSSHHPSLQLFHMFGSILGYLLYIFSFLFFFFTFHCMLGWFSWAWGRCWIRVFIFTVLVLWSKLIITFKEYI